MRKLLQKIEEIFFNVFLNIFYFSLKYKKLRNPAKTAKILFYHLNTYKVIFTRERLA